MTQFQFSTDLADLMPAGGQHTNADLSTQLAGSTLANTLVLTFVGRSVDAAIDAARRVEKSLGKHPDIAWVVGGMDEQVTDAAHALYFGRRFYFVANDASAVSARLTDESLRESAKVLKGALRSPLATLNRRIASKDPLLLFPASLERLQQGALGRLRLRSGRFISADGKRAVLLAATRSSAFDGRAQAELQSFLGKVMAEPDWNGAGEIRLEQSSVGRISAVSEAAIKSDLRRISLLSIVLLIGLFWLLYRSAVWLVLGLLPLACGAVVATAVCLALFGEIHGLTLAFGATALGVCIDYPLHFSNHLLLSERTPDPWQIMARVRPGLLLGCGTTVVGLAGLGWTGFPGVRQIAVFAASGTAFALLATVVLLPHLTAVLVSRGMSTPVSLRRFADRAALLRDRVQGCRRLPAGLLFVTIVSLISAAIPRVVWNDDLASLNTPAEGIKREDKRVRNLVGAAAMTQLVVAEGESDEEALRASDSTHEALVVARERGEIAGFRSPHGVLWSEELQRRNLKSVRQANLPTRLPAIFAEQGFAPQAFAAMAEDIVHPPDPLSYQDIVQSPLALLVRGFRLQLADGRIAYASYLRKVEKPAALAKRLERLPNVRYFDQRSFVSDLYRELRRRTVEFIAAGLLAVFFLMWGRYRRLKLTLSALVPAVLAALLAASILVFAGVELTLLHVMGGVLVLSMGVDYGVFLSEATEGRVPTPATVLGVCSACLTTVFSFGILSLSTTPALRALGQMVALGVTLALILAWVAVKAPPRAQDDNDKGNQLPQRWQGGATLLLAIALGTTPLGCTTRSGRQGTVGPGNVPRQGDCRYLPPVDLRAFPDFQCEQRAEFFGRGGAQERGQGRGTNDTLSFVLHKRGARLTVVGLTPMRTRAFTLSREEDEVRVETRFGSNMALHPRYVIDDIYRALFFGLGSAETSLPRSRPDGYHQGRENDIEIGEYWRGGALLRKTVTGPYCPAGTLDIVYGRRGWLPGELPDELILTHEELGYALRVRTVVCKHLAREETR